MLQLYIQKQQEIYLSIIFVMPKRKYENATVEVILLESDKHLGEKYEVVRVKPIFARNILLPREKAVLATPMNKNNYAQKVEAGKQERIKKMEWFKELFAQIAQDDGISLVRKVNKEWVLYGKVNETDIIKAIKEKYKKDVEDHLFKMKKKITEPGDYTITFIYKEYKTDVLVKVEAEVDAKAEKEEKVEEKEEVVEEKAQ